MDKVRIKIKINHLYGHVLAMLFIQMLLFPKILMGIKLLFIIMAIFFSLVKNGFKLRVVTGGILLLIYVFWNAIEIGIGMLRGVEMVGLREGTVTVAWPFVFFVLASSRISKEQLKWLYKAIVVITIILCIADIILLFAEHFGFSSVVKALALFNRRQPRASLGIASYPVIRVDHLYFYAFLVPFMIAVLMCQKYSSFHVIGISGKLVMGVAVLAVLLAVLSGMRGIWLSCAIGAFLSFARSNYGNFRKMLLIALGVGIFCMGSYMNHGMAYGIVGEVKAGLFPDNLRQISQDDLVRQKQARAMLESWMDRPLIGQGSGYPIEYEREEGVKVTETDSELSYLKMLYQRGAIGLTLFVLILLCAVKILRTRKDIDWFAWPFCVGMISFMTANIFNPYFSNMSNMWILFLPFLIDKKNIEKAQF